jgi:hypothetical protein
MSKERFSQLMLVAGLGIWVLYGFLAGMGRWPAAVACGLIAGVGLVLLEAGRHIEVKLLDWTIVAYFVLAAIATFLVRANIFPLYSPIVIWTLYAGVSWTSLLVGAPFSLQYARESTPPEHWSHPQFLAANRTISLVWSVAFTVNIALVSLAMVPRHTPLLLAVGAPLLMMAACAVFTSRYTKIARQRTLG